MLVNIKIRSVSDTHIGFSVIANIDGKRAVAAAYTSNPALVAKNVRKDDRFSVSVPDASVKIGALIPDTDGLHGLEIAPKSIDWASLAAYLPGVEQ